MDNRAKAKMLLQFMRSNGPCTVLTGAGVSVASGIMDFRGPNGLWKQYDPSEHCTIQAYSHAPKKCWKMFQAMYKECNQARPNIVHQVLALLEATKEIEGIVTMNIDGLHREAGSENVHEIHGNMYSFSVMNEGWEEMEVIDPDTMLPKMVRKRVRKREVRQVTREEAREFETTIPKRGDRILKPNFLLFGEQIPPQVIKGVEDIMFSSSSLVVLGSSMTVEPMVSLVDAAISDGIKVCFVNLRDEVPLLTEEQCLKIHGPLEDIFTEVGYLLME